MTDSIRIYDHQKMSEKIPEIKSYTGFIYWRNDHVKTVSNTETKVCK